MPVFCQDEGKKIWWQIYISTSCRDWWRQSTVTRRQIDNAEVSTKLREKMAAPSRLSISKYIKKRNEWLMVPHSLTSRNPTKNRKGGYVADQIFIFPCRQHPQEEEEEEEEWVGSMWLRAKVNHVKLKLLPIFFRSLVKTCREESKTRHNYIYFYHYFDL